MKIRRLDPIQDRSVVTGLFAEAADYVMLETGTAPNAGTVDAYFNDRPPLVVPQDALHVGMFDEDRLIGIAAMAFGYPEERDAYIGLLLFVPGVRGVGHGARLVSHLTDLAQARGANRQLVAVLEANPKGHKFWEREGFSQQKTFSPTEDGHVRHRLARAI